MRKIKSCPENLALFKNNKKILPKESISTNPIVNLDQIVSKKKSRFILNIINDNDFFNEIVHYDEINKSISYFIEFLSEILKNKKVEKDKIFQLLFNIIFRYTLYIIFHHSEDIINFKVIVIQHILHITS
tara:strand:+ start:1403 stop:1792 length:390 start_codon:yes stop_codon:yes gene_type:complete